jgi:tetratricopeptide (TPR) repeat protein
MGKVSEPVGIMRVVMVSPSDVVRERDVAQTVVDELNGGLAAELGCRLWLWRWEVDARPGMHPEGPQGLIDELMDIKDADAVVGVFWKRFGAPTGEASSGTEHELRRAWAAWQDQGRPEVLVYFCTRAYSPKTPDELAQWQRVLEFQQALPEQQLWWQYATTGTFERLLRQHLTAFLRSRCASTHGPALAGESRLRFNLPTVAASFTGRQAELDALDHALEVGDRAVITQAITGLGGVGKSQLAARYVQQRADGYDIVAWIRAEDGGIADLAQLAAKLGKSVEGLSPSEAAQLALDWLSDSEHCWLLVLDNVASPEQLDGLLPRRGRGRVLVTSRDRALRQFGPVLTVDVLDEDTATAYLTDRAGRPGGERAARQLARALGCLPLALAHAAAYCQSGTSFVDYLQLLYELPARDLFDSHPELSYAQTVASTWKASIQAATRSAPLAADVLEMAAHLAPDAIPKSLFLVFVDARTPIGRKRLADALNVLARFSLATVDGESVSVHRLLQKTIRDDTTAREDRTAALHGLTALDKAFPDDVRLPLMWPLCEHLLPHVLALAHAFEQPGNAGAQLVGLVNRACDYLNRAEPGQRGLATTQRALRDAERLLGAVHPETLTTRHHLATAHHWAGHTQDAIAILEPLLADQEQILGVAHPDTLTTRNSLAYTYRKTARVNEAIAILEPLLADRERIQGAEHRDTLSTRHNLARAYNDAKRIDEAIAIFEVLLAEQERILGDEHPDALTTRNNLAYAYYDAGRTGEAMVILEALLADSERILGTEHTDTLAIRHNLAIAYIEAGRTGEAIVILEALLAIREQILGTEHPYTLAPRRHLALAYVEVGRIDEAIAVLEALLADRKRILGAEHPDTLTTLRNLAGIYQHAGRNTDAALMLKRAGCAPS